MQQTTLNNALSRIRIATGRRFDEEAVTALYGTLKHIDDNTFSEVLETYLTFDNPPRNIEHYFKCGARQVVWERKQKEQEAYSSGNWVPPEAEVTPEQTRLFFKMVLAALDLYRGNQDGYYQWHRDILEPLWNDYRGDRLTEWLRKEVARLVDEKHSPTQVEPIEDDDDLPF